jgi:ribosomal protein S18 acetylase RimI-like enzyme
MKGTYIDRLYVDPCAWRKGWGTQLVHFAKHISPRGLELHTHQANVVARAFYERHGFRAVKFGLSPSPESAPDVEYHWRPE